jgi:6-phosphogluconolactonase (cycloisomerase 2 family)
MMLVSPSPSGAAFLAEVEVERDGVAGIDGLALPRWSAISPDGAHLYAAAESDSAVAVFSRNATTGALTFVEQQKDGVGGVDGLEGGLEVTVSPDGAHIYAVGLTDSGLAVFSRNTITGALTLVQVLKDGVGGVDGLRSTSAVTVSPDGAHVYATSFFLDNAVAVFSRNAITGALTFVETHKDGVAGVDGLAAATAVTVSPDGAYVLATGHVDDAVVVFARNASTGALTFVGASKRGRPGITGLDGTSSVKFSPDGAHAYVTSENDDTVTVFGVVCAGALEGDPCDDGDPCTTDDRCSDGLCIDQAAPPLGCRTPAVGQKALLLLKDQDPDDKDQLVWKWIKGEATTKPDFGDPDGSDEYGLCLYDAAGFAASWIAPAGGICADGKQCWAEKPTSFKYKDKDLTPNGLSQILLKEGLENGKAKIIVKGKGGMLDMPELSTLASPLTVRLKNRATATCWEATYSFPPALAADSERFKDKAD